MAGDGARIVVCEDDLGYQRSLAVSLQGEFAPQFVNSGEALLQLLSEHTPQGILLDVGLRGERDGFSILPRLRLLAPTVPVVIHSGLSDYASAVEAMRLGAVDFIPKGCSPEEVRTALRQALALTPAEPSAADCVPASGKLIVASQAMQDIEQLAKRLRRFNGNVIITGESGVGKEGIAQLLQSTLPNGNPAPFVTVDSSTIHSTTAESMLFGHERGSFTGAEQARPGLFEQANGGVIYFDEVANMPLDIQAKLLRVLQEGEVRRLGGSRTQQLQFRVVCATNQDLEALSQQGLFRFDLYTRLSVFPVHIPPLRHRLEDVVPLVHHFVTTLPGPPRRGFTEAAQQCMQDYDWPGNVREVRNTVEFALAMAEGNAVAPHHLPDKLRTAQPQAAEVAGATPRDRRSLRERLQGVEHGILVEEYRLAGRNISEMANNLKVDRSALHAKLCALGIHIPTSRRGQRRAE